jgi:hypothetical protein
LEVVTPILEEAFGLFPSNGERLAWLVARLRHIAESIDD